VTPARANPIGSVPQPGSVSVALCTYNGAAFVREQLESILAQTFLPTQIVVSDDGSTDATLDEVRRVLSPARIRKLGITVEILTRKKPLGVTGNFETAMAACVGEFIALSDQDDVWQSNRLEALLVAFDEPDVLLVHSDARLIDQDGRAQRQTLMRTLGASRRELRDEQGERAFTVLLKRNLVTGATAMVRSSHVRHVRPFPSAWVHDYWLAITASLFGHIRFVPELLIDYRQHSNNQIGVARLTPGRAVTLLGASRRSRHVDRVERIAALAARLSDGSIPARPDQRRLVAEKLIHEERRRDLPDARVRRWGVVAGELIRGRYHRLSRGVIDVVRDLFSPA
jgi:glycosyltransferase involved in cell wall biosynthesis